MVRQIIHIDEDKCNGCGLCANACHEGAIDIIDGKAKLVRENYCDGFGDCLPGCPMGAISFEEREAPEYDEAAVLAAKAKKAAEAAKRSDQAASAAKTAAENAAASEKASPAAGLEALISRIKRITPEEQAKAQAKGCPGSRMRTISHPQPSADLTDASTSSQANGQAAEVPSHPQTSQLTNWPPQIKLAPITAGYYNNADLLIAADCTAYSYAGFHREFLKGRTLLIGCPKLDAIDYSEKLTQILSANSIRSLTLLRMEVPCCGGMERALKKANQVSGKNLPLEVVTISIDGQILSR